MHGSPRLASLRSPIPIDAAAIKRNAFHDQGILVVDVKDPALTWDQREMLRQVAEKLYGCRS